MNYEEKIFVCVKRLQTVNWKIMSAFIHISAALFTDTLVQGCLCVCWENSSTLLPLTINCSSN